MHQRVLTALVLAPPAIAAVLWLPTPLLAALVALPLLGALWEWGRLAGRDGVPMRLALLAGNAALMAALAWRGWPQLAAPVVAAGVLWWLTAAAWLRWPDRLPAPDELKLLAGSLAVIPAWAALALLHADPAGGPHWLLFALLLVWLADTGAYLVGSRWGRRKLAPRISPNKTWEGLLGGLAVALLLVPLAAPLLAPGWRGLPALLLLAAVTVAFGVLGDLVESLLKRQAGSKDSGHLLPGHGGVLDRLDSLLAALPAFALTKLWLGL